MIGRADRSFLIPEAPVPKILRASVVGTIIRHDVRRAAVSLRFWAPALLLIVLMGLAAVTAAARHRFESAERAAVLEAYEHQVSGVPLDRAVEILHPALKTPWRLAPVVDGGQSVTPDAYLQAPSALIATEFRSTRGDSRLLPRAEPIDWMFAIRIVLSIGAFLLCHDAICGERRSERLRLLLSCPIPRWKILAGKFLAAWACLVLPLVTGAALSLALATGPGGLRLTSTDLVKAGLVVLLGLWAAAFFILAALLVSSLTRDPSTSLGVLALLWITSVVVIPALSLLLAHGLRPVPAEGEIAQRTAEASARIDRELGGLQGRWRRPQWAEADGYAWEKISARAENQRAALRDRIRREELDRKLEQARLADDFAAASPLSLVQQLAELLTGAGRWRERAFLDQAAAFHSQLAERVRALDAADPASPHLLFFRGYMSHRPIQRDNLPRFAFHERSVREGFTAAGPALLTFALETLGLLGATLFVFYRSEPG
ncbi:MAG TPA: ABC transporter permease subunit [Thermoanaerobaculia bacterium]|nr:ABC transporter permease subunit [Thermoanaerobaculia bacterium]